jgi:hypothetical protein
MIANSRDQEALNDPQHGTHHVARTSQNTKSIGTSPSYPKEAHVPSNTEVQQENDEFKTYWFDCGGEGG